MAEYKVNVIETFQGERSKSGHEFVGLYKGGHWTGKGDFCGWYAVEYEEDAILLACFETDSHHTNGNDYMRKHRIHKYVIEDPKPRRLDIYSIITERVFEAEDDASAIERFLNGDL